MSKHNRDRRKNRATKSMKTLAEVMTTNPPRLVVMCHEAPGGGERFEWGMVGAMPLLTLVGAIVRIQAELSFRAPEPCHEQSALVIVWDEAEKKFDWFVNPKIPVDPLVGMLEVIKMTLTMSSQARKAAAQQRILGPDGNPMAGS